MNKKYKLFGWQGRKPEKMATKKSSYTRLLVAAIDFGTTYSGYAFSFRHSPLDVKANQNWVAGSEQLISLKTPTCVLLDQRGQFHSFGYEAENKYSNLAEEDEHNGWSLYRRFKMVLHTTETLNRDIKVDDISGKSSRRALDIFTMSIKYLKDHLLSALNNRAVGIGLDDIQFVITVPAIWDDKAKQFMREAAIQGGVPSDQLKLALEPEAASMWCQVISSQERMPGLVGKGNKYMVIDLGGGTADITVHEKLQNGTLKEIHKASGGAWGGTEVDKRYLQMLTDIVGGETMEQFKAEQMGDYFDLLREFETKKRTVTTDKEGKLTFKISASMKDMFEDKGKRMRTRISEMNYGNDLVWTGDKIRLEADIAKTWFQNPLENLISHVTTLLREPNMKDVNTLLIVGGFAESQLVQDQLKARIKRTFVIPEEAGLVVLKGAVRFGHLPQVISSRKAKRSYGIGVLSVFVKGVHPENKRVVLKDGVEKCKDVYNEMVKIDDDISSGSKFTKTLNPKTAASTTASVPVYCSEVSSPQYITDAWCKELGQITVNLPAGTTKKEKEHIVEFVFGDTELTVTVRMKKTGKSSSAIIDCL